MKPPAGPAPPDSGGAAPTTAGVPPSTSGGAAPSVLFLLGVPVHNLTTEETLAWIEARARSGRPAQLVTSNLDFIMQACRDPEMQRIHLDADLVIADGWPPVFFSRLFGPRLKGRVAGSDLVVRLGPFARDRGLSIYALGGREGVAAEAMRILEERSPGLRVAGVSSPPLAGLLDMDHAGASARIREADPEVLLVAFGAPKQDKWIRINLSRLGAPVAMGIGASLDFIAGVQTRAPRWIQSLAMEWLWRLLSQPRRLFKRYSSNFLFLIVILLRLAFVRLRPAGKSTGPPAPPPDVLRAKGATLVRFQALATAVDAEAFCAPLEAAAGGQTLILDLAGFSWLSSLELGAIARLSKVARAPGRRLLLSGVPRRTERLLRILRLDRWLALPASDSDWMRLLDEFAAPEDLRRTRWVREGARLDLVLAEEFEGAEAARVEEELARAAALDGVAEVVIDGRRLRFIDTSGLLCFKSAAARISGKKGMILRFRSLPASAVHLMKREGLGALAAEALERPPVP